MVVILIVADLTSIKLKELKVLGFQGLGAIFGFEGFRIFGCEGFGDLRLRLVWVLGLQCLRGQSEMKVYLEVRGT